MDLSTRILFIDDDAIIIDKPAGLPVDTPKRGGDSVVSKAAELCCGQRASPVPMHRLDQDTSGCLLLARTAKARKMLQAIWEEGPILKHYLAVVDTEVAEDRGRIEIPLSKHSTAEDGWRMVPDPKGQVAMTNWWRLDVRGGRTLVRFEPTTGRTHQIRVHARETFGAGIVGDPIYGNGEGPMMLHASALALARPDAGHFDIDAEAPLPPHFHEWELDREAIDRDKELLRTQLTYRSISRDTDIAMKDLERPMFDPCRRDGTGAYWLAGPLVIDAYHDKGALEPLVQMYSGHKYPLGSVLDRILPQLVEAKRPDLMEKLWVPIVRRSRAAFFAEKPGRVFGDEQWAEKIKAHAIKAYDDAIAWLGRAGADGAASRMIEEREALQAGTPPELPAVSDLRKMDDAVFWELMARSRADGQEVPEQIMVLGQLLQSFKAADIKKFATLYGKFMRQLYHWNAWALAYAARGGCSDDSFLEFRTWLILRGDPALLNLAINSPAKAALQVPPDPELPDGSLLPVIDEAHYARAGSTFAWPTLDLEAPKGKEWPEDELDQQFPELAAYYES